MHVALIGLPGSGKSSVGAHLAVALGLPFRDCDRLFEEEVGCSVASFFQTEGEPAFRERESALLEHLLGLSEAVIATGGGVVVSPRNRAALRASAVCVWLRCAPALLLSRLAGDATRPLLTGPNLPQTLAGLASERDELYRETASVVVDIGDRDDAAGVTASIAQMDVVARCRPVGGLQASSA